MLKSFVMSFVIVFSASSICLAADSLSLTLYQNGTALVRDVRSLNVPGPSGELTVKDFPRTMQPGSFMADSVSEPGMFRIAASEFRPGGISSSDVLNRYMGKELAFVLPDTRDVDSRRVVKARLLGLEGKTALLSMDDGSMWIGPYEAVMLESTPEDAVLAPVMNWQYVNRGSEQQDVALSYLTSGLDWDAEMVLREEQNGTYSMQAWAALTNNSGKRFDNVRLFLVAGDVQRQQRAVSANLMRKSMVMMESADAAPVAPQRSEFGQWHLYDVGSGVAVAEGAVTRISLFDVETMPVKRRLYASSHVGLNPRKSVEQRPLEVQLVLSNDGTGQPVPAGSVHVYEPGPDGVPLFAGEASIGAIPEGGKATLRLGQAFDVTMDRKQTIFRKTGKQHYVVGYSVTLNNARNKPAHVVLEEQVPGQWKVVKTSLESQRKDAATMAFDVDVPGEGSLTLTYTLDIELQ